MPVSIDTRFLGDLEGFTSYGIVPCDAEGVPLGTSGVTVGTGVDLGQQTEERLESLGISPELRRKVRPYLGIRERKAQRLLRKKPLRLTMEEARILSQAIIKDDTKRLIRVFDEESKVPFEDLPPKIQTVIVSLNHQYGNLKRRTPRFWKQAVSGDWDALVENLRNFGDAYKTRRNKEADYIEGSYERVLG